MQSLITFAAFLLTLSIVVCFHEFGHFLAARLCGVKVLRFSLGFGKPIFTFKSKYSSTEWVLAPIPLGGYVKLLDGRDPQQTIAASEQSQAFDTKSLWRRSLIVFAGPLANFVLAVCLLTIIYVAGVIQLPARLQAPPPDSVAASLGIAQGDQVLAWHLQTDKEFESVISWNALRWNLMDAISSQEGFALKMQDPSGRQFTSDFLASQLPAMSSSEDPFSRLGILPALPPASEYFTLKLDPLSGLIYASKRVCLISKVSLSLMGGLLTGESSIKQLGGPLSIANMAGKTAQVGWQAYCAFLAILSISIGLLNLVPLPMLDGGQLLYDAWELVSGKRISTSLQEQFQKVGFILLISISLLALFNDLQRYFSP
ncbi:peptidase [Polynucleobacter paneuropaeus]|nr:peptidase [Polynucleobacter paneuropaeus]